MVSHHTWSRSSPQISPWGAASVSTSSRTIWTILLSKRRNRAWLFNLSHRSGFRKFCGAMHGQIDKCQVQSQGIAHTGRSDAPYCACAWFGPCSFARQYALRCYSSCCGTGHALSLLTNTALAGTCIRLSSTYPFVVNKSKYRCRRAG